MLFHTQAFLLAFLPAVLIVFYAAAARPALREWSLVAASVVFYSVWDIRFVPLLVGQTFVTWVMALVSVRTSWRWPLTLGIALNLASLGFFKYTAFLLEAVHNTLGLAIPKTSVLLPIGISFFTFELISYLLDLKRGMIGLHRLRAFCLYVFFFPHLIAGPIVRHDELIPQLDASPLRSGVAERLGRGATLLILGLAAKVLIADRLARVADPVFASAGSADMSAAWAGALAFSLQLFFDFAAYTDMALGIALMFGIVLPINFDRPYRARNLREFWRRWHITLSRWLRDYLYIPLGGSREGPARFVLATMVTMTLCGLWHGAAWTYVAWGALHGLGLLTVHAWQKTGVKLPSILGWVLTMLFVIAGWVLFRSPDFTTAAMLLRAMVVPSTGGSGLAAGSLWLLALAAVLAVLRPNAVELSRVVLAPSRCLAVVFAALAIMCILEVGKGQPINFVYFQF